MHDIALDLGTSTTLIYEAEKGIVLREPSFIAIDIESKKCLGVGTKAKQMFGRTSEKTIVICPIKNGVITDFEMTVLMLQSFINTIQQKRLFTKPSVLICVPPEITEVERRAVRDVVNAAGLRADFFVSKPIAAAIGMGLPVQSPTGNIIIDIGAGTTEISVIALSGIVTQNSIKIAGDEMDNAIIQYVKKKYNTIIGEQTAEEIKIKIGDVFLTIKQVTIDVTGKDLVLGFPKTIKLSSEEVGEAIREPILTIIKTLRLTLEKTPPEIISDILNNGIFMTGGCSLIKGIDLRIREEMNLPVTVAENPQDSVVLGAGEILKNMKRYEKVITAVGGE